MRYIKAAYVFLQMVLMMIGGMALSDIIGQILALVTFALLVFERGIRAFLLADGEAQYTVKREK